MIKKILLTVSILYLLTVFFLVSRGISDGDMYLHDLIFLTGPIIFAWIVYYVWKKQNEKK